jgi:hypothetical protein
MARVSRRALAVLAASLSVLFCAPRGLSAGEAKPAERDDPVRAEVKGRLRKPVTIQFDKVTIKEACERLSELSGCKIVIDQSVPEQDKRTTLPKMTISAEHALRWLCHFWRSTYVYRQGALVIVKLPPDAPQWCDYDIRDLLPRAKDGAAPAQEAMEAMGWAYVRLICLTVEPGTWVAPGSKPDFADDLSCRAGYLRGSIRIRHTAKAQEQVRRLLDELRRLDALRRLVENLPANDDVPKPEPPAKPELPPI